jgi:hypothetical protein
VFLKWVFAIFDLGLGLSVGCAGFVVGGVLLWAKNNKYFW